MDMSASCLHILAATSSLGRLITVTLPHVAPRSEREQTQTQQIKGFCTRGLYEEGPVSMAVSALLQGVRRGRYL